MHRKWNKFAAAILVNLLMLPAVAGTISGVDLYGQKQYKEALLAFEKQIQQNPKDSTAYYYSGLCYQQLGNIGQAKAMYRYVVQLSPNSRIAKFASSILTKLDPSFHPPEAKTASVADSDKAKSTSGKSESLAVAMAREQGGGGKAESASISRLSKVLTDINSAEDTELPTDPAELSKLPERARIFYTKHGSAMIMPVEINGRQLQMVFDTGAPTVVVSLANLAQLNIRPPEGPPSGVTSGSANKSTIAFWDMYATVKVGSITRNKVKIQVLSSNAAPPLLGQTFFKDFDYTIESGYSCVEFKRKGKYQGDVELGNTVPFRFREKGNRIIVEIDINGKKFPAMFDTGNSASGLIFHSIDQVKRYGIDIPQNAAVVSTTGVSGSGAGRQVNIRRVKLGPIDMYDAPAIVNWSSEPALSDADKGLLQSGKSHPLDEIMPPLLGQGLIKGWQYTIDMDKKLIHFKRF